MFRRAFLSLIPAIAALALLFEAPAHGAGDRQVTAWATDVAVARVAPKGTLRDDVDFVQNQWGDEDDTPDPVIRPRASVAWTPMLTPAKLAGATESVRPTHSACAFPPRAPPAA